MTTLDDRAGRRAMAVTDDRGSLLVREGFTEPLHGSVVLTNGHHGTAWQRHFADGMWRSTRGGRAKTWTDLLTSRGLVLVYDAPLREERR